MIEAIFNHYKIICSEVYETNIKSFLKLPARLKICFGAIVSILIGVIVIIFQGNDVLLLIFLGIETITLIVTNYLTNSFVSHRANILIENFTIITDRFSSLLTTHNLNNSKMLEVILSSFETIISERKQKSINHYKNFEKGLTLFVIPFIMILLSNIVDKVKINELTSFATGVIVMGFVVFITMYSIITMINSYNENKTKQFEDVLLHLKFINARLLDD